MYRIQLASDSADNLSSSRLLLEFIWSWSEFNSLLRGIKSGLWVGSNPWPTFYRGFASEELLFPVETQVFLNAYELFIWAMHNSQFRNLHSSNEFYLCLFVTSSSLPYCIILLLTVSKEYINVCAKSNIHYDHSASIIR